MAILIVFWYPAHQGTGAGEHQENQDIYEDDALKETLPNLRSDLGNQWEKARL